MSHLTCSWIMSRTLSLSCSSIWASSRACFSRAAPALLSDKRRLLLRLRQEAWMVRLALDTWLLSSDRSLPSHGEVVRPLAHQTPVPGSPIPLSLGQGGLGRGSLYPRAEPMDGINQAELPSLGPHRSSAPPFLFLTLKLFP